ncbi:hypothetical protein ABIB50_000109 [Mucilaginibacter sp. UYCu711]
MNNSKLKNILYIAIFSYIVIAMIVVCVSFQNLVPDTALTLKMTDNGYRHIPFNHYQHPKTSNINEDENEFVSWWSPGQFALPMLIEKCLNVRLSIALKILIVICLLFSGFGIYKLYSKLIKKKDRIAKDGYPTSITALCLLLFTLFQPFFWDNLFVYDGGGILMLAYCPWFIYWVIKRDRLNFSNLALLVLLSAIGFFLKASFTNIFCGALLYLFLSTSVLPFISFKNLDFKKIFINGSCLGIALVIYLVASKFLFLNHNRNISDSSLGIRIQLRILAYPVVAPFLGFFSLHTLNKTIHWLIGMVVVLPVYYLIIKSRNITPLYKTVLLCFAGVSICFYTLIYFMNVDVSYEYRHFMIITVLLTPTLFIIFWRGQLAKTLLWGLVIMYTAFNAITYINAIKLHIKSKNTVSDYSGLTSPYPQDLINKIHSLDNLNNKGRDIFYLTAPHMALEIRNNRVLLEDNFLNFHFNNDARHKTTLYYGKNAGNIYLLYPQNQFKKDSIKYLTRFEKYKKFEKIYQSTGYAIYKALANTN